MLKLLYKTILISFMSCSLMTMNLEAYAQDAAATAPGSAVGSHKFEATSNDNMISTITMLAVGAVGMKLLLYKKWTPDMMAAVTGSAVYILGEVANLAALKDQVKETTIEVTNGPDGKPDQTQIATLEKLKKSYQAVQKSGKIKKMLQMAAAAAFGVALGIAAWQSFTEAGRLATCEAAIATATPTLTSCAAVTGATGVGATEAAGCASCNLQLGAFSGLIKADLVDKIAPMPSLIDAAKAASKDSALDTANIAPCYGATAEGVKATVAGACTPYLQAKKLDYAFGEAPIALTVNNTNWLNKMLFNGVELANNKMSIDPTIAPRNFLQKMLDIFIPRAEAGIMSMLGLGAGAAAIFFTTQTTFGKMIDTYMFNSKKRMIVWGVMTVAAMAGAMATQSEMDKVDGNIKKIDQILADLHALQSGVALSNATPGTGTNAVAPSVPQGSIADPLSTQYQSTPLSSDASSGSSSASKTDCLASAGNSNCTSVSDALKSAPGFADLPDSLKSSATQSAQLANGLGGTSSLSGSTLTSADSLANKQAAIAKIGNIIKKKINDALAKAGKPAIDFDKQEKSLWNQMKGQTDKALKSKGMSADSFLANTGISPSATTATVAAIPSNKPNTSGFTGAAFAPTSTMRDDGKDLNGELKKNVDPLDAKGAEAETKDEKFDIGANDIDTNSSDSIFQLISNRYLKSGYPKLFNKIPEKK
ncbi:MAG: hypothetical protein ACXVCE_09240 [Bacteriovorax sp.]